MSEKVKPPVWYWIVSVIAVLWNLLGVFNYIMQSMMTDEMIAALEESQRQYVENVPAWATAGFAIAVFAGLLASVLLLMRKSLAYIAFIISFLGVLVQQSYWVFMSGIEMSMGQIILPLSVFLFSIALIMMSKGAKKNGWIA